MTKTERIQYLAKKAQRGVITQTERQELARLLGRNPDNFQSENGLSELIGIALIAIALALLADLLTQKK
jgi:hypothetical protein